MALTNDLELAARVVASHVVEGAADVHALVVLLDGSKVQCAAHLVHDASLPIVTHLHLTTTALRAQWKQTNQK